MTGIREILEFKIVSGLPHKEMMNELAKYNIGLVPFRPHPFQRKCSLNKMYEYLHAGLQVVLTANFIEMLEKPSYVHTFNDYDDIAETIDSIPEEDPNEIMEYAREHFIWDSQEDVIKSAYAKALNG